MNNETLRKGWQNYFDTKTYRYFVTISFKYGINRQLSIDCLNKLLHFINAEYYGRNYESNDMFIKGFACHEPHTKGNLHFHLLIEDDIIFNDKSFNKVLEEKKLKIRLPRKTRISGCSNEYRVFGPKSINVHDIYSKDVYGYMMKQSWKSNYENLSPLTRNGVCFSAHYEL